MESKKPVGPPKPTRPQVLDLRKLPSNNETTKHPTATGHQTKTTNQKPSRNQKNHNKSWKKITVLVISLIMILGGIYILFILLMPIISRPSEKSIRQRAEVVVNNKNQVFIPTVGIQSEIKEGGIDILDQGVVWHRLPERGNPEKGGNFILTGHSFVWGYTPQQVTKQSVFYHLAEVKIGDEIVVHWNDKKYTYIIKSKQTVKPDDVGVEKISESPKLTMYTCTSGGSADGRVVITAEPKQ